VNRADCLKELVKWVDVNDPVVTSLSSNSAIWPSLREKGANFYAWNMGLTVGFSVGLSFAFPKRKVIALDSDGSLMIDTSALITMADANPTNLIVFVFDNEAYARMGPTFTSRRTDLEKMAQGAGIQKTATIRTLDEFIRIVQPAVKEPGPHFFVVKVEAETVRIKRDPRVTSGRPMKEAFVNAVLQHPDYWGKKAGGSS
jgi:thiamine pyrophosphate-dependent acetolactate synthase large subunit-like protein